MPGFIEAGIKMQIRKYIKPLIICAILLVTILSVYIEPLNKKDEYIYTHLFYIPVILAAYWYHFHSFWVIAAIALLPVFPIFAAGGSFQIRESFINSLFFALIALVIIFLKKKYSGSEPEKGSCECSDPAGDLIIPDNIIQEQKKIIAEKDQHLKEVYHRVKNNMQVVTSLISLQIVKEKDANIKAALVECQNRVKTMTIIQDRIYSSENDNFIDLKGIVESMVPSLMRAYKIDKEKVEISVNVPEIKIDLNTAIPLSQIINEILSNSLKHAFPGESFGRVEIKIHKLEGDTRSYSLCISDNGIGIPDLSFFPEKGKLGFHLISALSKQMGGGIELDLAGGTSFEFKFALK